MHPRTNATIVALLLGLTPFASAQRTMERLDRGVVATRVDARSASVSWRLFATDEPTLGFDLYRSAAGGAAIKLNATHLRGGTNFRDTTVDGSKENRYWVRTVPATGSGAESGSWTLKANAASEPAFVVPLRPGPQIHFAWVGDLDGDGEYDYVVDRLDWIKGNCRIEAYRRDGKFLWQVDYGPNSSNMDNISPGSATIGTGMWDGVTVYDLDMDGKAEVITKIANGVVLGDGTKWSNASNVKQWIAVLDGATGKIRSTVQIPEDYISIGPVGLQLGIGYFDGKMPSIVGRFKNRKPDKSFNDMICAFHFSDGSLKLLWKWKPGNQPCPAFHQIRVVDVDGDGKDDVADGGYVVDENGALLYTLAPQGVGHGDRYHIGKLDPSRPGLQGYGIQQDNPNGLKEYYYDAGTGKMIWKHSGEINDWARGTAADVDPNHPGYEVWTFNGLYNASKDFKIAQNHPYPTIRFWWDGDDLSELYNDGRIEEWNYTAKTTTRLVTTWNFHGAGGSERGAPQFFGDIVGDWREEAILATPGFDSLVVFTTQIPTTRRLYTLAQNPAYRNGMTVKGYYQSHMLDYYLGHDMEEPPKPNIVTAGSSVSAKPSMNKRGVFESWRISRGANGSALVEVGGEPIHIELRDVSGRLALQRDAQSGIERIHPPASGTWILSITSPTASSQHRLVRP